MTPEFFAAVSPRFAIFTILVWIAVAVVVLAAVLIIVPRLARESWAWMQETFGSPAPVEPRAPSTVVSFALHRPRSFREPAAKGWDHERPKFHAIVGGRQ